MMILIRDMARCHRINVGVPGVTPTYGTAQLRKSTTVDWQVRDQCTSKIAKSG